MEPEIELELFAALCADVEAGRPLADVLRAEGLLESTWAQSRDAWMGRMSNGPEAERKALEERYLAAFHARKRVAPGPFESGEESSDGDDPPTRRAPMGTVIIGSNAVAKPEVTHSNDPAPPPSATPPMGIVPPKPLDPPAISAAPKVQLTPPMGVVAPNLADVQLAKPLPKAELTPPMGVAAPNLADIAPPKPLPNPEHTPPMGIVAPNLADIPPPKPLPNPEHTPPMGVAAPNLTELASAPRRRTPEPTPPMRPRSDFISDDMARAASDAVADRKTDPPPPVPSRPALPFPASMQTTASGTAPMPPASAPFRPPQAAAGYPVPPPVPLPASPAQFPQAAPQPPPGAGAPTYGAYPSMMSLVAQAATAQVPAPTPSSPGFSPAAKPAGPPLALGGFPATASGPRLTLEVYAAFAAEIALKPVDVAEIRERYGFTDVAHTAEDEAWQRRFSSDRDTYVRYAKLFQHYRDWFSGRTPR